MRTRWFLSAVIILVLAAVIFGLFVSGGIFGGRKEKYDDLRIADLVALANALICQDWRVNLPELPKDLTLDALRLYCGGAPLINANFLDDETGQPYIYERIDDHTFRVCARFYDVKRAISLNIWNQTKRFSFYPDEGCLGGAIH